MIMGVWHIVALCGRGALRARCLGGIPPEHSNNRKWENLGKGSSSSYSVRIRLRREKRNGTTKRGHVVRFRRGGCFAYAVPAGGRTWEHLRGRGKPPRGERGAMQHIIKVCERIARRFFGKGSGTFGGPLGARPRCMAPAVFVIDRTFWSQQKVVWEPSLGPVRKSRRELPKRSTGCPPRSSGSRPTIDTA